jgi:anti-sigma-K factor RskA
MNCADVQDLAELFVLGAVEPEVAEAIEEHLTECEACRRTIAELSSTAEALRLAVPAVAPPAGLRQRLLDTAAAEARPRPLPGVGLESNRPLRPAPRFSFLLHLWPRLATAALLVLLVTSGWLAVQYGELRGELRVAREEQKRTDEYEQAMLIMQRAVQQGGAMVSVDGTENAPDAKGMVYALPRDGHGVLMIDRLPRLSGDQGYQLWLIRGDTRTNGGYFEPEPNGRCIMMIDAPMPLEDFDAFGVTNERRGGSPEPHGSRVMWGRAKAV